MRWQFRWQLALVFGRLPPGDCQCWTICACFVFRIATDRRQCSESPGKARNDAGVREGNWFGRSLFARADERRIVARAERLFVRDCCLMKGSQQQCCNCKKWFIPDLRNWKRQRYCTKAACRKARKKRLQKQWLQRPENRDYWRGAERAEKVRAWRKRNPGYWRGEARHGVRYKTS